MATTSPVRFGLIGTGWRSEFFVRLAGRAPDRFQVTGVVSRRPGRATEIGNRWGVPTVTSLEQLLSSGPEFVIPCVPWSEMAPTTLRLVEAGMPVVAETPPAADLEGLRYLWASLPDRDLVQVAEQYLLMPQHRARMAVVDAGMIGDVTSVQVSSTHLYHAVSMIRGFLGVGRGPVAVHAAAFVAPLANPLGTDGWSGSAAPELLTTTLATLDFGPGKMGLYDFTDNQWWNPLRARRIVIRGTNGEIVDEKITRLVDPFTPVESHLIRRQTGLDLNLEGMDLQHISVDGRVVYRNRYAGARYSEDDLGVAELLAAAGAWRRGEGEPPYPLAEACHDHQVSLAIEESVRSGRTVTTSVEGWSDPGGDTVMV
ncbi:MAG TPA: Gfo/Idh/MocA family oxidoreductase [Microlunatus sp.]|nr:Gfo/Idh/MocA family oxidoreductase [Microlunatus sp.]